MPYKNIRKQKEAQHNWYLANKEHHKKNARKYETLCREKNIKNLIEYLLVHPCVDCNEKDIVVLEFDHVRGEKEENISSMLHRGYSWERVEKEIGKCEVRCANCHRRKTAERGNYYRYALLAQ